MTASENLPRLLDELEHASPFRAERLAREVESATAALGDLGKGVTSTADTAAQQSAVAFIRSSESQIATSLSLFARQQGQMATVINEQMSQFVTALHEQAHASIRSSESQIADGLSLFAGQQGQMVAALNEQMSQLAAAVHEQARASMVFRQYVEEVKETQDRLADLITRQAKLEELASQLRKEQERIGELVRHLRPGA